MAFLIISVSELLLPVSPIKTTYTSHVQQESMNKIRVSNINDELFLSQRGNPISIRLEFTVQVPKSGIYSITPSAFAPEGVSWRDIPN